MRPKTGFGVGLIEHCGLRLGLLQAVLLLCREIRTCNDSRHNELEGHSNC